MSTLEQVATAPKTLKGAGCIRDGGRYMEKNRIDKQILGD